MTGSNRVIFDHIAWYVSTLGPWGVRSCDAPDRNEELMAHAKDDQIYEALGTILVRVKELFEKQPANRKTYIAVLAQLSLFLRTISDVAALRWIGLAAALYDLDQGKVPALLKPATIRNRPGDSSALWAKKAHAAIALECFVRSGETLENGARKLALCSKIPAKSLIAWRRELKAGRVKNVPAPLMFANGLARLDAGRCGRDLRAAAFAFIREAVAHEAD
jgi:hypothetical protein